MKLSMVYDFLVLQLIYAFSCLCVRVIETSYGIYLQMLAVYTNMWSASINVVLLSVVVIVCIWFVRSQSSPETVAEASSNTTIVTHTFDVIWFIGLIAVVTSNMLICGRMATGEIDIAPALWGIGVNVFAVILYCISYFTAEKYGHRILYKSVVSAVTILMSVTCIIFSQYYMPISVIRNVHKDGRLHDMLRDLEREIKNNSDWKLDLSQWEKYGCSENMKQKIKNAVANGDITISEIDDTHIKMGWKRNIDLNALDKMPSKDIILNSYRDRWYDWGTFYTQQEKVIEMQAKIKKQSKKQ